MGNENQPENNAGKVTPVAVACVADFAVKGRYARRHLSFCDATQVYHASQVYMVREDFRAVRRGPKMDRC